MLHAMQPSPRPFVVTDFDNTCIVNDIGEAAFAYVCEHALLRDPSLLPLTTSSPPDYHEAVFHCYHDRLLAGDIRAAYALCTQVYAGFTSGELSALAKIVLAAEGEVIGTRHLYGREIPKGIRLRDRVRDQLQIAQRNEWDIWIVSASPEPLVRAAAAFFNLPARVLGMRLEEHDGVFTKTVREPMCMYEGKVARVQQEVHPTERPMFAIGDSLNDAALLDYANEAFVVDRHNGLSAMTRERGWHLFTDA